MDVLQVLQNIGYTDIRDLGQEYQMLPLYRESDNHTALCVNKRTGVWWDFVTRKGGGLPKLVQITLRLANIEDADPYLGDVPISNFRDHVEEVRHVKRFNKDLLVKLKKDHTYWLNRNVSKSTIETFEGGTTFNGRMAYRYVFPIFDERDNLIGFSGRRLNEDEEYFKWKHLGKKTNWLYPIKWNMADIQKARQVVLVESIGDMLALWDAGIRNVLVTFGVVISEAIVQFLIKMDVNRIVIAFNNDEDKNSVGNDAAVEAERYLGKYFDPPQVTIGLPDKKDFGEMNFDEIMLWKSQHLN